MHIIIDVALVFIVLLFGFLAYKKGFLATLLELVGFILSAFASIKLSPIVSNWIYGIFVKPRVIASITEKLTESKDLSVSGIINSVPSFIVKASNSIGGNLEAVAESGSSSDNISLIAEKLNSGVVEPVVTVLIKAIVTLVIFILAMIVIKLLVKLLKKVNKLPLLGKMNKSLGFILGVGKGAVVAIIVCFLVCTLVAFSGGKFIVITKEAIDKSYIFSWLSQFNPLI